ncbi:MAG: YqzL family protein [Clostridia bacterium]|nr:YqzL family protein [Clostridia bacterium]
MNNENYWNFFRKTGNLDAYLTYIEFCRLTAGENADEIIEEVDVYDSQNERRNLKRSENARLGQDVDGADR